ncbi:hypothetical protein, partial [Streptomyces niveus]|uniref:hypothetical protein n=1 Tax=Streptomyces niveus TaxID=193462 RepID=UPI003448B4FB
ARPVPDTERRERYAAALYEQANPGFLWVDALAAEVPDSGWREAADAALAVADEEQRDHIAATKYWFDAADERCEEIARLRAELEKARALKPAAIQECPTCGAGYTLGEPCSACEFKAQMAAETAGSGGQAEDGALRPPAGDPDCERCDGTGLDPDAYTEQRGPDGGVRYRHEPCTGLLCTATEDGAQQ